MIKIIRLPGKLKGLFFLTRLHLLVPSGLLLFLAYLSRVSLWITRNRKIPFNDFYCFKFDYSKRYTLYDYVHKTQCVADKIDYLEFGVSRGSSLQWWIENLTDRDSRFYGFDTFSGLPEDWGFFKKGDMHTGGNPPFIQDDRVKFYKGLFQQTLPGFLREYEGRKRKIIHMDADLYSSTLYVLTQLTPIINKGDIILFDEFNVPMHEFRAFSEWTEAFYIQYEVLGSVNNFYQVAFIIK